MYRILSHALPAAAAVVSLVFTSQAHADVVLSVDVSDPSMVTLTSTGAVSSINATGESFLDGVSLLDFLATPATSANIAAISGDLRVGVTQTPLNTQGVVTGTGLFNIFSSGPDEIFEFQTTAPAFTGQGVFDLSQQSPGALPAVGATGSVVIGLNGPLNQVIGTYVVVPEPTSLALLGLGGLLATRRRREANITTQTLPLYTKNPATRSIK